MQIIKYELDLFTKVILAMLVVSLFGLSFAIVFAPKISKASYEIIDINIEEIGGRAVNYGGPISVKIK